MFINALKQHFIFPFFISNVNEMFFSELNDIRNKPYLKKVLHIIENHLNDKEIEKLKLIQNLTRPDKIKNMINLTLRKIIALTGTEGNDFFLQIGKDQFQQPLFINNEDNFEDLDIIGNVHADRRFSYVININPHNYLFKLFEEIQLAFYIDQDTNKISGAFSLNKNGQNSDLLFDNCVDTIYFQSLITKFIKSQLNPLSLDNMLSIINNVSRKHHNRYNQLFNIINFDEVEFKELETNWKNYVTKKFLTYKELSETEEEFYKKEVFYSLLITILIMLYLLQEINSYFTAEKPELILQLLNNPIKITDNKSQNYLIDLTMLADHLENLGKNRVIKNIHLKNINTADELIDSISQYNINNFASVTDLITTYEIITDEPFTSLSTGELLKNDELRNFVLIILFPEIYGISEEDPILIEYKQFIKSITSKYFLKLPKNIYKQITNAICEFNYGYISFVKKNSVLIFQNIDQTSTNNDDNKLTKYDNQFGPKNRQLYNNYFWAEIYVQSKVAEKNQIELEISTIGHLSFKQKNLIVRELIKDLDELHFDYYDHFYGLPQIRKIVQKIDAENNLKNSLEILTNRVHQEDKIAKKQVERGYVAWALIVAMMIGLIDFISMVFSILPNRGPVSDAIIFTFIGIGSAVALLLIYIMITSITQVAKLEGTKTDKKKK